MKEGTRVEMHPAHDVWMQGDRFGEVVGYGRARPYINTFTNEVEKVRPLKVKLDKSGRVIRCHPDWVTEID